MIMTRRVIYYYIFYFSIFEYHILLFDIYYLTLARSMDCRLSNAISLFERSAETSDYS